jgi:ergothioneine biosynthesis protein EgtB
LARNGKSRSLLRREQRVRIGADTRTFAMGESMLTEYSRKYTAVMTAQDATVRLPELTCIEAAYRRVRAQTLALISGLTPEDCTVQSMTEASPIKWHLAHVTWFFETLVLEPWLPVLDKPFEPFRAEFRVLFNSYYNGIGPFHARPQRGVLSRPSLHEVCEYRAAIDEQMLQLMAALARSPVPADLLALIELGVNHEQQHQELILADIKHHFSCNPLHPVFRQRPPAAPAAPPGPMRFAAFPGGRAEIGHRGLAFAFDNETPQHRVWLEPYEIACRLVSNAEYLDFVEDGGYQRADLWLSDGWDLVQRERWSAPLYWRDDRTVFTLAGLEALDLREPVCHVSYFEADAYARWAGARLPSESEWECAARLTQGADGSATSGAREGNFLETGLFRPRAEASGRHAPNAVAQLFGDAWEWTQSAYLPYPGFKPARGATGEYNGKFMINQMVLRGGSCATPADHVRPSYRNFFHPYARWQFSGIRLARS